MAEYHLEGINQPVTISRRSHGVVRIAARTRADALYGLGWAHGKDRGGQLSVMRTIAQGRACELLRDDDSLLELDLYFRRLGLARDAKEHIGDLPTSDLALIKAYARGINKAWQRHFPTSLRLALGQPESFDPADALLIMKLMAFAGLAESQRIVELFLVEAVRRGTSERHLKELIPTLDSLDTELIRGLREVSAPFPGFRFNAPLPLHGGSNAWVVSGHRTASGHPILANDPHLEINRLPAAMYEATLQIDDIWIKGATIPGLPGVIIGRTPHLAWGVTYSCADTSDFFVERCRNGRYLHGTHWHEFRVHQEVIHRCGHKDLALSIHTNPHGALEGDPAHTGDHLCWNWVGMGAGGVASLRALLALPKCRTVPEAQSVMRGADIPTLHMLFADTQGNIGYQLIGKIPRRRNGWSGLAPVPGWDPASDWQGYRDPHEDLPWELNPADGLLVVTNEARQRPEGPPVSTVWLSEDRKRRINELLSGQENITVEDMQALQYDVLSVQARQFLPEYLTHLPDGPERKLLENWDCRYDPNSVSATLFENLHRAVVTEVFARSLGRGWFRTLMTETGVYTTLAGFFDDILKRIDSAWLPAATRAKTITQGLAVGLRQPRRTWGKHNAITFRNLFFGNRLPRLLGFDPGPYPLAGNHATIHQGNLYRMGPRVTTFAPCYHFISDLGDDRIWTNLPGGASESRLSRYYSNDLKRWRNGTFKDL